jgi:hypothetical protein
MLKEATYVHRRQLEMLALGLASREAFHPAIKALFFVIFTVYNELDLATSCTRS